MRQTADGPSIRRTNTRSGALTFATEVLYRGHGGECELHEADGTVTATYQVLSRTQRPWWYSPPRLGLLIAATAFFVEGAADIWAYSRLMHWVGWILAGMGALQIASYAISKRSDRALCRRSPTGSGRA